MDKNIPTKVIVKTAKWYSFGYTPTFRYCPNCEKSIGGSHKQGECRYCGQKIIW